MCSISSEEETIEHPDSDPNDEVDDSWTERILHITISAKTADEMRTVYHFSDYQNEALDALTHSHGGGPPKEAGQSPGWEPGRRRFRRGSTPPPVPVPDKTP